MSDSPILLTGAAGFIGSHLGERLLDDGWRVVGLDDFNDYYDPDVKRRNVEAAQARPGYRLVEGDIRDAELLDRLLREESIRCVVHLAARAGVRPSIEDPILYTSVNVDGTMNCSSSAVTPPAATAPTGKTRLVLARYFRSRS